MPRGILANVGDPEFEQEERSRRGRRWLSVITLGLVAALLVGGAWVRAQVPEAAALSAPLPGTTAPTAALDSAAADLAEQLSAASGRTLDSLAQQAQASNGTGTDAADDALTDAEEKAAEGLAVTPEEAKAAEAKRKAAEKKEAEQSTASDAALDAAIDAAIAAARNEASITLPVIPGESDTTGSVPQGAETSTAQVLSYVRKYFPAAEVGNAMAVARCESGHANRVGKTNANGTRDYGVFQLNDGGTLQAALNRIGQGTDDIATARERGLDAETNVEAAHAIWASRGWQPWVCAAKLKIVAGLYQRTPGPMAGKYDEYGRAL